MTFGEVQVANEIVHVTADGKRYLIAHGDAFDGVIKYAKWLAYLGDTAYQPRADAEPLVQPLPRQPRPAILVALGLPEASGQGCGQIHQRLRKCDGREARRHGYDGVICGHIHKAESRMIDGRALLQRWRLGGELHALVEHMDGRLEIVEWAANRNFSMLTPHLTDEVPEDEQEQHVAA